jgi:methylase of polypeptide subunit release factors
VDGLDAIRRIAEESRRFLTRKGHLMFEHGYSQQGDCADILASFGYANINCHHDLAGRPRVGSGGISRLASEALR